MRIAVVGSGVAGLSCAHVLGPAHDVTIFEADDRLGGHANTVVVDDPAAGPIAVDTGFIVHNDRNYPNLCRLFDELGVPTQDAEMSFAVTDRDVDDRGGLFTYRASNPSTIFADRRNLARPAMWRMLADIVRFYRAANRLLASTDPGSESITLGEFLATGRYSSAFVEGHLVPLGASVWSADPDQFDAFPAVSLFRFLRNHGLLGFGRRPQWRTIPGGSRVYVDAIADRFRGTVRLATPVEGVRRDGDGVQVRTAEGSVHFDRVVLACHPDQSLRLLDDASDAERDVLGAIAYQPNTATLHTDTSVLSPVRRTWAAWNYECPRPGIDPRGVATLTYDMTNLQRLPGARRYLVSLNSEHRIDPATVLGTFRYAHPVFDGAAIEAQGRFEEIDGVSGVHYCGAYWGYGFHEDGISSALRVCERLGVPW
ncbi:MAG: FAD-dependent oxidoreductase [Acidimicrobiales bacterium]